MAKKSSLATSKTPIYLKQVRIRNYAPLRDAKASFKPGMNIIIGPNGVGKTRFFNLTSLLVDWFETPKLGVGCEIVLGGYDQDIKVSYRQPSIAEEAALHLRVNESPTLEVQATYGTEKGSGDDLFEALADMGLPYYQTVLIQHGTPLQQSPLVDVAATLIFGGVSGMRVEPELISTNRPLLIDTILSTLKFLSNRRRRYQRANKLLISFSAEEARIEVERVVTAYLEFLTPILAKYSPIEQVRLSRTYQVYENAAQQETLVKGLVLEYFLDENWLPFEALSDGTKRMLYLISQLVMPIARFDGQAAPPIPFILHTETRIIFLEEPELGVHHAQLHKLLHLIREVAREQQIILTTHSPQVLDILEADELDRITVCSLHPAKGTQFSKLSKTKQEQARIYMKEVGFLSDYWRYSYLESEEVS